MNSLAAGRESAIARGFTSPENCFHFHSQYLLSFSYTGEYLRSDAGKTLNSSVHIKYPVQTRHRNQICRMTPVGPSGRSTRPPIRSSITNVPSIVDNVSSRSCHLSSCVSHWRIIYVRVRHHSVLRTRVKFPPKGNTRPSAIHPCGLNYK